MDDFIEAARHELEKLEAEVRADPRHEKIRRLRELLAMYESPQTIAVTQPRSVRKFFIPKPTADAPSKAKAMEGAIATLLTAKGEAHRSVILAHLKASGIMGHESKPMKHLASFLSARRNLYTSDGSGNFRLVDSEKEAAE